MNRKLKALLTALIVCTFILPTSYVSAKTDDVKSKSVSTNKVDAEEKVKNTKQEKYKGKSEKDKEKNEKSKEKNEKQDKHLSNMTEVIFNRLDLIEKEASEIEELINKYFNTETSNTDSDKEDNTEETTAEDAEKTTDDIEAEEATGEDPVTDEEALETEEGTSETEEVTDEETSEDIEDEETIDEADEDVTEEEQEELEDTEEGFENEDNGRYNSFYGKLNAQLNKLDSVVNKLDSLSKRYGEENEELIDAYAKVEEMKERISSLISDLDAKQDKVVKSVREEENKKVIEPKEEVAEDKSWQITFSKELAPETVNGENIVVSDAEGNIIAADISYNSESKQVSIKSTDSFESGKTYYLNISTNVKSAEGNNLSEAIEMGFTIG